MSNRYDDGTKSLTGERSKVNVLQDDSSGSSLREILENNLNDFSEDIEPDEEE